MHIYGSPVRHDAVWKRTAINTKAAFSKTRIFRQPVSALLLYRKQTCHACLSVHSDVPKTYWPNDFPKTMVSDHWQLLNFKFGFGLYACMWVIWCCAVLLKCRKNKDTFTNPAGCSWNWMIHKYSIETLNIKSSSLSFQKKILNIIFYLCFHYWNQRHKYHK